MRTCILTLLLLAVPLTAQELTDWQQDLRFDGLNEQAKLTLDQQETVFDGFLFYNLGLITSSQLDNHIAWYQADVIALTAGFALSYKDYFTYKSRTDLIPFGGGIKTTNWKATALGVATNRLSVLLYNGLAHGHWSFQPR